MNLKNKSINELEELSKSCTKIILDSVSKNGGHLSSNLGVVDLAISMYYSFDFTKDKLILDVGHQCYTFKILSDRDLSKLRLHNGVGGFPNVRESNIDVYSGGHSSTSISVANGYRLIDKDNEIVCLIGDGSFQNGLVYEALSNIKGKIIIVLNNNSMSISPTSPSFLSLLNSKEFKDLINSRNINVFDGIDGHDIKQMNEVFEKAKLDSNSSLIIVKTIKGKGYKYSENDLIGVYHKVTPFNLEKGVTNNPLKNSFCYMAADYLEKNIETDAFVINPATVMSSSLLSLQRSLKDRFIDVGMQEENALTMASAIGSKKHCYVILNSSFAQRGYDQLLHDVARNKAEVTVLIDKVGFMGQDGATHHGIYDLSFLQTIPNLTIFTPSSKYQLESALEMSKSFNGPLVIRMTSDNDNTYEEIKEKIKVDNDTLLITYGPIINKIKSMMDVNILELVYQKPLNRDLLTKALDYKKIVIYDKYSTKYGFSSLIKEYLIENNYKGIVRSLEIPDEFIDFDDVVYQEKYCKVDIDSLMEILK